MKKKVIKFLAVLMSAVLLLAAVPTLSFAANGPAEETVLVQAQDDSGEPKSGMQNALDLFLFALSLSGFVEAFNYIIDAILLAPFQVFASLFGNS